jgi:hypothetical protein
MTHHFKNDRPFGILMGHLPHGPSKLIPTMLTQPRRVLEWSTHRTSATDERLRKMHIGDVMWWGSFLVAWFEDQVWQVTAGTEGRSYAWYKLVIGQSWKCIWVVPRRRVRVRTTSTAPRYNLDTLLRLSNNEFVSCIAPPLRTSCHLSILIFAPRD